MESFASLLFVIGAGSPALDFVADLPPEVSQQIFGYLNAGSLIQASHVSRRWMNVCRGDPELRRHARRHLRKERRKFSQGGLFLTALGRGKMPRGIHAPLPIISATFQVAPTADRIKKRSFVSKLNRSPKSGSSTRPSLRI